MKNVGITACSNGLKKESAPNYRRLIQTLQDFGCNVKESSCIFEKDSPFSGSGEQRACQLMKLFSDNETEEIYDVSGGDMANQVLDILDYNKIAKSKATFWGYSDLTTVINALYTATGKSSVLYQIRNIVSEYGKLQQRRYLNRDELFNISYSFIQGSYTEGVVVGGNIRCFLKLAGTKYFPSLEGKILLLEGLGGQVPQMVTYLSQLKQLGAFGKVNGILLGTFTKMEENNCKPNMEELVKLYAGESIPIIKTPDIGHNSNAKAIKIGEKHIFKI
mgnify:FL=1